MKKLIDYEEGDIIVALKGNVGAIRIATAFECMHIPGNFRKVTSEDRVQLDMKAESEKLEKLFNEVYPSS